MKKIFFALAVFLLLTLLCVGVSADTCGYDRYKAPVGEMQMKYATPSIDGNITALEGWGKAADMNGETLVPVYDRVEQRGEACPTGTIRYAFDENNLYFAADIKDENYIYCTGYFKDDSIIHDFILDMPQNEDGSFKTQNGSLLLVTDKISFFGYDGDVLSLAFNWNNELITKCGMLTEFPAFIDFGLFEDGHIGVMQTVYGEKDLTGTVTAKGKRTADGWCFEAAVPWSVIAENFDLTSVGEVQFDYAKATEIGAQNKACVFLSDRFYDPEYDEITTKNLFATYSKYTARGALPFYSGKVEIGLFGIDLIPTKTGSDYTPKQEKTSLEWVNPYKDVDEKAWYFSAVGDACKKGRFYGTSETTFSPSAKLTRAMFVQVLAKLARCDDDMKASGTMFKDVPANKWYSASVEWAAGAGFAAGTGEGLFSPDAHLTREQCAMFLYRFAQYKHYRVDDADANATDKFTDKGDVSAWARDAVNWAITKGLLSGIKTGNTVRLEPRGTATRAQCAQIIKAFDSADFTRFARDGEFASITVCGGDISDCVIIYGGDTYDKQAALELQKYIKKTADITLPAYRDTVREEQEKEILVGKTNRENGDFVIDYSDVTVEGYTIVTKNGKLVISGGEIKGTLYGVYRFIEKYLGWIFASSHKAYAFETEYAAGETVMTEDRYARDKIDIADGICEVENSQIDAMAYCDFGMTQEWQDKMRIASNRVTLDDGVQTGLPLAIFGNDWEAWQMGRLGANPCYSNQAVLDRAADMTLQRVAMNYPSLKSYSFAPFDSYLYCTCPRCLAINREEGTRGGTYFRLVKYVADKVAEKYPDVIIYPSAYGQTQGAPRVTKMPSNVAIRYVQLSTCYHHELDDPNCDINKWAYTELLRWKDVCDIIWIGDHGVTFAYDMAPCMNFDFLYGAHKIYHSLGYSGYIYWPDTGNVEFNTTRDYLINHVLWDPDITRDEYWIMVETVFEARFGKAWRGVLDYYDTMVEIQKDCHFTTVASIESTYSAPLMHSEVPRLDALWADMFDAVKDDKAQYTELYGLYAYYLLVRNDVQWEYEYKNGTPEQKAAYSALSEELSDIIHDYNIAWSENKVSYPSGDPTVKPSLW